jgi:colicin import membrane protein
MSKPKSFFNSFFISAMLHVAVIFLLIMSFEFSAHNYVLENSNEPKVINAVMLEESKIQRASPTPVAPKLESAPLPIVKPQLAPKPVVEKLQEAKKQPEPQVQKKVIAIPEHPKKNLQKELFHQDLLADLKEAKTIKKKKHQELQNAFEKELKAQASKSLEQQMQKEQSRLSSSQAAKMSGIVDKYKALILQAIAQHWLVPNGADESLSSQLLIHLAPGGSVLDVQLVKSSGDDALDRSARTAVFKASPLPVPTAADEFEPFRQFILKVKPENILARDNGLNG